MNNPPAFPTSNWQKIAPMSSGYNEGMELRDYFAARAMQALLSDSDWRQDMDIKDTALAAYKTADAMMKERGREE
jgi:hypothetical protein